MKKIIVFLSFAILTFSVNAQSITIPDPHFASWLSSAVPAAMSGNQLDTSSLDVKSLTSISVGYDSIQDLTGIQYFTSLRTLNCSGNRISYIPAFPDSLETLICSGNYLDSLPAFPVTLSNIECAMNYLDSLPPLPAGLLSLNCSANHLSGLSSLPNGLTMLNCSGNILSTLPSLPDSLHDFNCSVNQLHALPVLPAALFTMNCSGNPLSSLPALPAGMRTIECSGDSLSALPALPASLIELDCYYNALTVLPALPAGLEVLVSGGNLLTGLPALPSSLLTLKCYSNQLPVLPALSPSLTYLDCSQNLLSTLPTIPATLAYINCASNNITLLPTLTPGVQTLDCSSNMLPGLPALPSTLNTLNCSTNPLTGLPVLTAGLISLTCANDGLDSIPALPATLYSLTCDNNLLVTLPALASLNALYCAYNQLAALPLLPATMNSLVCNNNQLTSLPALPASISYLNCANNLISCFSAFSHLIGQLEISGNTFTCLPNYIPAMDSVILGYPLCIDGDFVNNPSGCTGAEGILGFTYLDNNADCMKDSSDLRYTNIPMKLMDGAGVLLDQTYTASNGIYNFSEAAGNYTVIVDTTGLPFVPQCATPGIDSAVAITTAAPLMSGVNFDFACKPGFDIGVRSVITHGWVFPGQQHELSVVAGDMSQWYNMHCAAGTSGTVKITVDGPVVFAGAAAGALSPVVTGHDYTYAIADFGTISNATAFGLLFNTDTTALGGAGICVHVLVTPLGGDNDSSNNVDYFCYNVVNSHDPNLKEVFPEDVSPKYMDWLTYTIHFQNTGTAPAVNIHLEDTLDAGLDLNTFQVMNYSHANTVALNENRLTVRFPNIMLPDSGSDAAGSQGYIQYRIKLKHYLPVGTIIRNTAYIYFDYNEPVVTNTTENELIYTVSVAESEALSSIGIYPNPVSDQLFISYSGKSKEALVRIYDLRGKLIKEERLSQQATKSIDVNALAKGMYILKIVDADKVLTEKFLKQ